MKFPGNFDWIVVGLDLKQNDIIIYKTEDNQIELKVQLKNQTVWLDQKSIAQLFGVNIPAISKHISNIFEEKRAFGKLNCFQNGNSSKRG
ncbi:hypothetical protein GF357_01955 [Candidatus Dojkabacteria bacterium]|nr:hypothetical protein [Candidatus Dojkabacteria bacterium]